MKKLRSYALATAILIGIATPATAQDEGWDHSLTVYLWAVGLEGESQIGPITAPINITFSDALDNLSSVLTLHYEAQKGQWGFLFDINHVGLDPQATLPSGASLDLDITNNIIELGGIYQPDASGNFEILAGLRFSEFELVGTVPGIAGRTIADERWVDGFIGGRVVTPMGESGKWGFRGRFDVGTGDSDLVLNAILGFDYRFNDRVSGLFGYHWLDYDYDNEESGPNRFTYDITYDGPVAAIAFHW